MKKIETREQLNDYFKKVNSEIDKYINEHNIRPSRLKNYINNNGGVKKFVSDLGLAEIIGINSVVEQALNSRIHMEKDGIMTFESFRTNEELSDLESEGMLPLLTMDDVLFMKSDIIKYEKALASYFETSLSHVEENGKNRFKVNDIGSSYDVYIFSDDDIDEIISLLSDYVDTNAPSYVDVNITKNFSISIDVTSSYHPTIDDYETLIQNLFSEYDFDTYESDDEPNYIILKKKI